MKSSLRNMALSLTGIAAVMGAALGVVHHYTEQPIAQAVENARYEALSSVLPSGDALQIGDEQEVTVPGDSRPVVVFPAEAGGKFAGAAVETWTMDGFSGEIDVMVGFSADGKISGYKVLSHAETPGLGAKAEEWFRLENETSDGATGASQKGGRSIIGTSRVLSVSKDGGDIDGITAATITSRAFLQAVNRARKAFEIYTSNCD